MFVDRADAGRKLAGALLKYREDKPVVLAVPSGGVPVGYEVALALDAPLDVIVVRKLAAPFRRELGIGALADGDQPQRVFDEELLRTLEVSPEFLSREVELELREIHRREQLYRRGHPAAARAGRTAIVVDDGVATGASAAAALRAARQAGAAQVVLAVPIAPPPVLESLRGEANEAVCLAAPEKFSAVGEFYDDYSSVSDQQVINLLDLARIYRWRDAFEVCARPALAARAK